MAKLFKPLVFIACLVPLALIAQRLYFGFVANPVDFITGQTGLWALRFLLLTLALTPLRWLTRWETFYSLRRMLGLYAFFYAMLHMGFYWWADLNLSFAALWQEIVKRRFITFGLLALLAMLPLALTSTQKMVKRLGGKRWKQLHRLTYAAAALGVLHFYWLKLSKSHVQEPLFYAAIFGVLLLFRFGVMKFFSRRRKVRA